MESPIKVSLEDILKHVEKRPGMYLVNDSIYALAQFITGYEVAVGMNFGFSDDYISFMEWTEHKYEMSSPAWNWSRILHHQAGTEQAALALFFKLWSEYVSSRDDFPRDKPRSGYSANIPNKSVTDAYWSFLYNQQWPKYDS